MSTKIAKSVILVIFAAAAFIGCGDEGPSMFACAKWVAGSSAIQVQGNVKCNSDGTAEPSAKITIGAESTNCDGKGVFQIGNISVGSHQIKVTAPDHYEFVETIEVKDKQTTVCTDIYLVKK